MELKQTKIYEIIVKILFLGGQTTYKTNKIVEISNSIGSIFLSAVEFVKREIKKDRCEEIIN